MRRAMRTHLGNRVQTELLCDILPKGLCRGEGVLPRHSPTLRSRSLRFDRVNHYSRVHPLKYHNSLSRPQKSELFQLRSDCPFYFLCEGPILSGWKRMAASCGSES